MEMAFQKVWNGWLRQLKENLEEQIFKIFILTLTVLYNYNLTPYSRAPCRTLIGRGGRGRPPLLSQFLLELKG